MQHHTLETIYTLLSASTTPKQNIRVEIKKLLPLIAQLDPINYLDYYQEIMLLIQQIEQETQQKQTAEKTIIGVGGGFSAGKSRFINSLLAIEALPEALEPCTAVATYLSASQQEQTHALNLLNHHISLKSEQLGQLRHFVGDNSTQNDIQLGELIQHVHLGIPQLKWEHIAFLDTPGYSKADSEHHHHSDEKLAINQLSKTDYIIWLVNAKNGTIRDEDLQFLQKITPKEPVFVVLTQSDLVNRSDIEPILKSVRKNLKSRNIKIAGLMAWAAPIMKLEGERLAGDDIQQWLNSINQPIQHHTIEKLETLIQNILSIGSNQTKQLDKEIETLNIIKNKQKDAIKTNVLIQSKKLNKEAQIESNCALALQMANIYEHLFENLLGASKFHVMIIDYLLRFLDSSNDDGNIKYFLKEHTLGSSSLNWLYTKSLSDVTSVKTEFERLVNRSEHKELQYKYAILLEKQQNIESAIEYMFFSAKQNFSLAYDWLINYAEKLNIEAQFKITELFKIGVEKDASNVFNYCYNAIRYNNDLRFLKFLQSQAIDEKNKHAQ
ncbi:dynamin family protein [Acinetobacter wanghuae]|uniref:dynamin family protein n=1 Tax=Acinetobacter wanghuae TaxID=2662362 RepID=UPI003AF811DC